MHPWLLYSQQKSSELSMPQEEKLGPHNKNLVRRTRLQGASIRFTRRPVQPSNRKGTEIPGNLKKTIDLQSNLQNRSSASSQELISRNIHNTKPALPRQSKSGVLARNAIKPKPRRRVKWLTRHRTRLSKML